MKNFFFWLTRIIGMSLVLFQLYRYAFENPLQWESFKDRSILYDFSYMLAFNVFLLLGIILIFISYKLKKKDYSVRE